jgi:DNA invertase Pin-like site-specific DNA recombinase
MSEGYNYSNKRYIVLVRASDTTDGTTSTEAQLAMLHAKAAALKMVCADNGEIVLNNVTGSMPGKRQDMTAIIQRKLALNDFDVLVVQRLDRLTRSGSDHGFWFEHELKRAGIHLYIVGDDIPEGRYASLIKVAKYEAAREQAFSISQRSTQGYQLALEEGRVTTSSHTPFACWRLYLAADGNPLHIIRDLRDGRQQKLDPKTHAVIDTYGQIGGGSKGHYRKQKQEKVLLMPGDADEITVIRTIFDLHFRQGWGGKRIADHLNRQNIPSPCGKQWSQRPQHQYVLAAPRKRQGDKVDPRFNPRPDVFRVLIRQRRQIHLHPRKINMPPRAQLPRRDHPATDVRRVLLNHLHANQPAVQQHRRANADIRRQTRIIHVDSRSPLGRFVSIKLECFARLEFNRRYNSARANFRPFDVHHHRDVPMDLLARFADAFDDGQDPLARPMRHVEPDHIHSGGDHLPKSFARFRGRPHGGYDFSVSVMTAHDESKLTACTARLVGVIRRKSHWRSRHDSTKSACRRKENPGMMRYDANQ